jgi:hypothetical protein
VTGAANAVIAVKDLWTPIVPTEVGYEQAQAYARALGLTTTSTRVWLGCSICRLPHTPEEHPMAHQGFKTRHISLGADGTAIVSQRVWEKLQRYVDDAGFTIVNTVPDPPAVTMSFRDGARDPKITVHHKVPRELKSER